MTVEQIMELVSDYASEIADIASSEAVFAHIGKSRYADIDKLLADIRTAIEELAADAAKWREYKTRKDAVIAAGMGKKAMRDSAAGAAPNKQVLEELEQLKTKLAALEVQEPVMIYEGRCIFDCGDGGHQDVTMLKMIPKGAKLYRAAPAGTVLTTIIAEIEAIDCYYYGDPPHEHCPFSIREKASDIVKKHAKQLEAAPAQQEP